MEEQKTDKKDEMKVWLCLHCKHPIGSIFPEVDGNFVRIKTKGGIVDFTGGMVSVLCSRCAGANVIVDEEYSKLKGIAQTKFLTGTNFPPAFYQGQKERRY